MVSVLILSALEIMIFEFAILEAIDTTLSIRWTLPEVEIFIVSANNISVSLDGFTILAMRGQIFIILNIPLF